MPTMTEPTPPSQSRIDPLDPARAAALHAALASPGAPPQAGDPLPPFFHQVYFWDVLPPAQLGRDGHPARGQGIVPDLGLPRRMWAGGQLRFHADVTLGAPAERITHLEKTRHTQGRSGPLAFVTLRHEIHQNGALCVTETQDLVFRQDPTPGAPSPTPPQAPDAPESSETVDFDPPLLFRYSALMMNGHRIHYDRDYATGFEGYGGLVVHGPLLAQLLMLKAARELGPPAAFSYRGVSALMDHEPAQLCRAGTDFWVTGPDGRLCMQASARPA